MPKLRNAVYLLVATCSVAIAAYQPDEITAASAPTGLAVAAPEAVAPIAKAVTTKRWQEAQAQPQPRVKLE